MQPFPPTSSLALSSLTPSILGAVKDQIKRKRLVIDEDELEVRPELGVGEADLPPEFARRIASRRISGSRGRLTLDADDILEGEQFTATIAEDIFCMWGTNTLSVEEILSTIRILYGRYTVITSPNCAEESGTQR
ncbi:hypothetical protein Q8F55_005041 [Vanrija albida]|uniref:Uncharacterized protein n=1 Tax=Vanrija albida TaxID=181172 RepID=A0ABR3Q0I0_9TREE